MDKTKTTFIEQLKAYDDQSWERFYADYAPMLLNFARKRGCSDSAAEDVLQETIAALLNAIPGFNYNRNRGKFRSFLFKITESKISNAYRRSKRLVLVDNHDYFVNQESGRSAKRVWDETWESNILFQAIEKGRERLALQTFQCFEYVFLKQKSVAETAELLGISANLVSQHKHKTYQVIMEEAEKLRKAFNE